MPKSNINISKEQSHVSLTQKYEEYKLSGKWKCKKSPNGGHYDSCKTIGYIYPMLTFERKCKYCNKKRIICVKVD